MTIPALNAEHRHPLEFLPWVRRTRPNLLRDIVYTLIWSEIVAVAISLLTLPVVRHLSFPQLFWMNSVYSILIGLCIHATQVSWRVMLRRIGRIAALSATTRRTTQGILIAFAVIAGFLAGSTILQGLDGEWSGGWRMLTVVLAWVAFNVVAQLAAQLSVSRRLRSELMLNKERQLRSEAERAFMLAKVQALHAQIEPHFLFNSLANVSGLVEANPAAAAKTLNDLSNFLRGTLDATRSEYTTVSKEVALLRAYLGLMQVRMSGRLTFSIAAPDALSTVLLPSMLVQPLVENSLKHSVDRRLEGGRIHVEMLESGTTLRVSVCDNGGGFPATWSPGVGLTNVRERLDAIYGDRAGLHVGTNAEGWTTVEITLPLERAA